jgi:HSP20 family protein
MALVRFDPLRGFENMMRKMNDFVGDFDKGFNVEYGGFAPRCDISEDEKNLYVHVELAGIKKEDVKVTINDDNLLIIKGEKKREEKQENEDKTYIRVERTFGAFTRSFMLPENVKHDSINAKYENGVLNITLEKVEPRKPREVEISVS